MSLKVNAFFYKLVWSQCFVTAVEKELRQTYSITDLKIGAGGDWKDGSVVKGAKCSYGGPGFDSQEL